MGGFRSCSSKARVPSRSRRWAAISIATCLVFFMAAPATAGFLDDLKKGVKDLKDAVGDLQGKPSPDQPQEQQAAPPPTPPQQPATQQADAPRFDRDWVLEIQTRLAELGYKPGPADGAFGEGTSKAIIAFQQNNGLVPAGLPTPSVMDALRFAVASLQPAQQPPVASGPAPTGLFPSADLSHQVEFVFEAQNRLTQLGYNPGPIDGAFGSKTARAIRAFQRDNGLRVDGWLTAGLIDALHTAQGGGQATQRLVQTAQPGTQTAGVVNAALPSFEEAPAATYRALLEMQMASNPEAFNNAEFAIFYMALDLSTDFPDPPCLRFRDDLNNEIVRQRATHEALADLAGVLGASSGTKQVRVFRIVTRNRVEEYDFGREGFPVTKRENSPFSHSYTYSHRAQPESGTCSFTIGKRYIGQYRKLGIAVPIPVQASDVLLPMSLEQAEEFIDRNPTRSFETEWLIEVRAVAGALSGRCGARARAQWRARSPHF